MSRTHRKHCFDGYGLFECKPWTQKGLKGYCFEYWGRRALTMIPPGRGVKRLTHKLERAENRRIEYKEFKEATHETITS